MTLMYVSMFVALVAVGASRGEVGALQSAGSESRKSTLTAGPAPTDSGVRIELHLPTPMTETDVDFFIWTLGFDDQAAAVLSACKASIVPSSKSLCSQLDDELRPASIEVARLHRPINDEVDRRTVKQVWIARSTLTARLMATELEQIRAAAMAQGTDEESAAELASALGPLREVSSLGRMMASVPGARPDALRLIFEHCAKSPGLPPDVALTVRQLIVDEATRLIELRRSVQSLTIRACTREHEEMAKWRADGVQRSKAPLRGLTLPIGTAEARLASSQTDLINSVCSLLDLASATRLLASFQGAAYGDLAGDPFDWSELLKVVRSREGISAEDRTVIDSLAAEDNVRRVQDHERLLVAVDSASKQIASTMIRDPVSEEKVVSMFNRWIDGRRSSTTEIVLQLRALVDRSDSASDEFDARVARWKEASESRARAQRADPVLSMITPPPPS